jgi:2-iminobutanoate/2-iminopropanoate deaminase
MVERISPPGGPPPRGPYSPAVRAGDFVFVSGQIAPEMTGDIRHETRQVLTNIGKLLEAAQSGFKDAVKVNVYLADAADFAAMNEVYAEFFGEFKPARATIICKFIVDARVEIDCTAYTPLGTHGA